MLFWDDDIGVKEELIMGKFNSDDLKRATSIELACDTFRIRFELTRIEMDEKSWLELFDKVNEMEKFIDSHNGACQVDWRKCG